MIHINNRTNGNTQKTNKQNRIFNHVHQANRFKSCSKTITNAPYFKPATNSDGN